MLKERDALRELYKAGPNDRIKWMDTKAGLETMKKAAILGV